MKGIGCEIYLVNIAADQPDAIWVTEVWSSKEAHGRSLALPSVRAAIQGAMPLLTGEFESVELDVVGSSGFPDRLTPSIERPGEHRERP